MRSTNKAKIYVFLLVTIAIISALKCYAEFRAKILLGGDIEISSDIPMQLASTAFMRFNSKKITEIMTAKVLVQAKSVSDGVHAIIKAPGKYYPLYGKLGIGADEVISVHRKRKGAIDAVVNKALLRALKIELGQYFKIENRLYQAHTLLVSEPDNADNNEPRILVLNKAGARLFKKQKAFNSAISYHYRAILNTPHDLDAVKAQFIDQFGKIWAYKDWRDMVPASLRFISWTTLCMLAVLTAIPFIIHLVSVHKYRNA